MRDPRGEAAGPVRTRPSIWAQLLATAAIFFGGGAAGIALASMVAPGSDVARVVAFVSLPLALITGFHLWLGAAIILLLPRLWRALRRREWRADVVTPAEELHFVPPGHAAFVVTSVGWSAAAGLVTGLVPAASGFLASVAAFLALGLTHGLLARELARSGLLPFPDEA